MRVIAAVLLCLLAGFVVWSLTGSPELAAGSEWSPNREPSPAGVLTAQKTEEPEDDSGSSTERRPLPQRFQVYDEVTGRGIVGARITLFDTRDQRTESVVTKAEGLAILPRSENVNGLVIEAVGYGITAVDVGVTKAALIPGPMLTATVHGASPELLESYTLELQLTYDELRYPFFYALRVLERRAAEPTVLTGTSCELPRPIAKLCRVTLYGRHRASGKAQKFDDTLAAYDEHAVEFDASNYRVPSPHWLRAKILIGNLDFKEGDGKLHYLRADEWRQWADFRGQRIEDGQLTDAFTELHPGTYRISLWLHRKRNTAGSRFHSQPFEVKGGTTKTIRLQDSKLATIECHGINVPDAFLAQNDLKIRALDQRYGFPHLEHRIGKRSMSYSLLLPGRYAISADTIYEQRSFLPRIITVRAGEHRRVRLSFETATPLTLVLPKYTTRHTIEHVASGQRMTNLTRILNVEQGTRSSWLPKGLYRIEVPGHTPRTVQLQDATTVSFR